MKLAPASCFKLSLVADPSWFHVFGTFIILVLCLQSWSPISAAMRTRSIQGAFRFRMPSFLFFQQVQDTLTGVLSLWIRSGMGSAHSSCQRPGIKHFRCFGASGTFEGSDNMQMSHHDCIQIQFYRKSTYPDVTRRRIFQRNTNTKYWYLQKKRILEQQCCVFL